MLKLLSSAEVEKLGPYELVGQLASGGMATVFLARRAGLGGFSRYVAIKRLRPELSRSSAFLAMLMDEARLAARIHHPNVAATLELSDAGDDASTSILDDQGQFYLVMEYVEGGSLLDLVSRSASRSEVLPPKVVVRIVLDALAGLHAAHELRDDQDAPIDLVHRDLSPHNLMIGLDGCTRVVDFGLARAASRLTKTAVGTLKGKLAYMAPEQLHQRPLDRRADLFSVGVVLWEGLSGERLFRADTDVGTIERVLRGEIPSLRTALPWLSEALDRAVMKALAREPDARFQTAEEMSLAISEAAEEAALMGSRREVGACVARLLGDDLAARREALRNWIDARGVVESPSQTQLAFSGLATSAAWFEDRAGDAAGEHRGSTGSRGETTHEDDPARTTQGSVIGAPHGVSIAPISSPPHRRRASTQRPSLAPLLVGAVIGLSAIGLALFARAGGHLPLIDRSDPTPAARLAEPQRASEREAMATPETDGDALAEDDAADHADEAIGAAPAAPAAPDSAGVAPQATAKAAPETAPEAAPETELAREAPTATRRRPTGQERAARAICGLAQGAAQAAHARAQARHPGAITTEGRRARRG